MYSLFVILSRVMGRNTVFHRENSRKEDLQDFILRALSPFTGIQSVPDLLTSLNG